MRRTLIAGAVSAVINIASQGTNGFDTWDFQWSRVNPDLVLISAGAGMLGGAVGAGAGAGIGGLLGNGAGTAAGGLGVSVGSGISAGVATGAATRAGMGVYNGDSASEIVDQTLDPSAMFVDGALGAAGGAAGFGIARGAQALRGAGKGSAAATAPGGTDVAPGGAGTGSGGIPVKTGLKAGAASGPKVSVDAGIEMPKAPVRTPGPGAHAKTWYHPIQNEEARLAAFAEGRLFRNKIPEASVPRASPIPTENIRAQGISGKYNYVVRQDGSLVLGKQGHYALAGGKEVRAAGEVKFVKGDVKWLDNASGHYQPSGANAQAEAIGAFKNAGLTAVNYIEKIWDGARSAWVPSQ